ncbi:MAG TPA: hypothetical protein VME17_15425 [Bryobacteraceae bacterium]|nr:hypothetical protein [Bryobacteraceae bacterium]
MSSRERFVVSLFAVAAITAPAVAQQQQPIIQRILLYKVKSDRVSDYEAAVREYMYSGKRLPATDTAVGSP